MSKIKIKGMELHVCNFYPFRYQTGKLCVRFEVSTEETDFQTLYALLHNNADPIEYYESDEAATPVMIYHNYSEFACQYQNGMYSVEQVAPSVSDVVLADLQAQIKQMTVVIQEQSEAINNQAEMMTILTECALEMSGEVYQDPEAVLTKELVKEIVQESQCEMLKGMITGFTRKENKDESSNYSIMGK